MLACWPNAATRFSQSICVSLFLDYTASRYTHGDIEFRGANVLEIDTDRRFDLIFANQIIERLVYPEKLVSRALARGRGGGVLSDDRK